MLETHPDQVRAAISSLGIRPGDGLLVHSALQYLGRPVGGPGMYLDVLREVLGPEGTLAVPTFNFGFAKGEPFDRLTTPSRGMGVFSEIVRQCPGAERTSHPLQSLAILGKAAQELAGCDTLCAFDPGSAFERMLELNFKLLLLGADIQAASMVHYCEQRAGVPYRYWKEFSGQVRAGQGWQERTCRMYVRDLEIDPQLCLKPIQTELEQRGAWHSKKVGYGLISACSLVDFVNVTDHLLAEDVWALVENRSKGDESNDNDARSH